MSHAFKVLGRCFALAVVAFVLSSCDGVEAGKAETNIVSWPELEVFDALAYRAEGLAKREDREEILRLRPALLESGMAVSASSMPERVENRALVSELIGDLRSLLDGIARSDVSNETLFSLVEGLHPVAETMMEIAGVPHLHANKGPHGGRLHPVFGEDGGQLGRAEIKLHEEAGKIEVWLTSGGFGGPVWDLSPNAKLTLTFPDLGRQIVMTGRDTGGATPVGGGKGTGRAKGTNYFVFPGEVETEDSWLEGPGFVAKAVLVLEGASTGEFTLRRVVQGEGESS
ncbi:MAG: hypothetical protein AAGJ31_06690 [Verrucomicrobiota bacterium]